MKIKSTFAALSLLITCASSSDAAIVYIKNTNNYTSDTLYANNNGTLMNGGVVTIGFFTSPITQSDIDTIPELVSNLGNFTTWSSAAPGSPLDPFAPFVESSPGYVNNVTVGAYVYGAIVPGDPLLGRTVYSIVTSAATLGAATLASEFALVEIGTFVDETGGQLFYTSDPAGKQVIIGTNGTFTGDLGISTDGGTTFPWGTQTYGTLNMAVVPEPSAALLGALGALGLLRRRRI